jgi:hypothetical protein
MDSCTNIDPLSEDSFNEIFYSIDDILVKLESQMTDLLPTLVFIVDVIDQLEETKYKYKDLNSMFELSILPSELRWLPRNFHSKRMKLIVSCLDSTKFFMNLHRKVSDVIIIPKLEKCDD